MKKLLIIVCIAWSMASPFCQASQLIKSGKFNLTGVIKNGSRDMPGFVVETTEGNTYAGLALDQAVDIKGIISGLDVSDRPALKIDQLNHIQMIMNAKNAALYKKYYGKHVIVECDIDFVGHNYTPVYCKVIGIILSGSGHKETIPANKATFKDDSLQDNNETTSSAGIYVFISLSLIMILMISIKIFNVYRTKQKIEAQFFEAKKVIDTYAQELSIRRNQLTLRLNYGLIDDSKWQKEVELFVSKVIYPVVGNINADSINYTRVRKEINRATSNFKDSATTYAEKINRISPIEYEQLVAGLLRDHGWDARTTATTGDQGVDVIAEKDTIKVVIQCKLYSSAVGNSAVQEIIAGKAFERAHFAAVVSNAEFTRAAQQLASSSGVFLLHHDQLSNLEAMCV